MSEVGDLRTQMIASQAAMINLQEELISCKNDQLASVQAARSSQDDCSRDSSWHQSKTSWTKMIVVETWWCSVLLKKKKEELVSRLEGVFEELGEKPCTEASRVGIKNNGKERPVKVKLSNSELIQQILAKAKKLRQSVKYKEVYICPDRTVDQRRNKRNLYWNWKYYFYWIRNNAISSKMESV